VTTLFIALQVMYVLVVALVCVRYWSRVTPVQLWFGLLMEVANLLSRQGFYYSPVKRKDRRKRACLFPWNENLNPYND